MRRKGVHVMYEVFLQNSSAVVVRRRWKRLRVRYDLILVTEIWILVRGGYIIKSAMGAMCALPPMSAVIVLRRCKAQRATLQRISNCSPSTQKQVPSTTKNLSLFSLPLRPLQN